MSAQPPFTQKRWPEWMRQLPRREIRTPTPDFELIPKEWLRQVMDSTNPEIIALIMEDIDFLNTELLSLFRLRDYEAKVQQNSYRRNQLGYMLLAALAVLMGALLALSLSTSTGLVPWFGFAEVMCALSSTYLATISGREAFLPQWLSNRRRAEGLRREYFRYVLNLPPYSLLERIERKMMLSRRASAINRGAEDDVRTFEDESAVSDVGSTRIDREYNEALYKLCSEFIYKDQVRYYNIVGESHRTAARQVNSIRAILAMLTGLAASLCAAITQIVYNSGNQCTFSDNGEFVCASLATIVIILAILAIVLPTLSVLFHTLSDLYQWDRQIELYTMSLENLEVVDAYFTPKSEATDKSYREGLSLYAEEILKVMTVETYQFVPLRRAIKPKTD